MAGDSGAVGRVHVSKKRGMVLDLKVRSTSDPVRSFLP